MKTKEKKNKIEKQPIIFAYGDDYFRLSEYLKEKKTNFISEGFLVEKFESGKSDIDSILFGLSLFSPLKVVLIDLKDINNNEAEYLLKVLETEPLPENTKILAYYPDSPDKRTKLFKNFDSLSQETIEISQFSPWKLNLVVQWAKSYCEENEIKVDKSALELMVDLLKNDTALIVSELRKIQTYCIDRKIELTDVKELCNSTPDLFQLVGLLLESNLIGFTNLWDKLTIFNNPLQLLATMQTIIRGNIQILSLNQEGFEAAEIARITGKNPWKTSQDLYALKKYDLSFLIKLLKIVNETEEEIKIGQSFNPSLTIKMKCFNLLKKT